MTLLAKVLSTVGTLLFASVVWAGSYDAPGTYYNSATGTGSTLKSQLHNIIDNHTFFSYNSARSILQDTDVDPNNSDRMLLVYNRVSLDVSNINPGGSIPGWDSGNSWNREHTWPRSLGVGSSGVDNSDLHQLRPSNPSVNSQRGNLHFGGAYGAQGYGTVSDGGTKWYPGDTDAGMIARQEFYMAVRYDGSDSNTENLELTGGSPGSNQLADLDRMVEWHFEATPDDFELRRNDVIYDDYQGNRNPFVDRPEYVWSVFVDQSNDSQVAISGAAVGGDGGSSLALDLGSVYVGGVGPSSQSVTLNKNGSDGTYYEVTPSGDATSTLSGRLNAFSTGGTDSTSFTVGLNASTGVAGLKSGQVVIDNLDVTTSGGTGHGANDADDTIDLSFSVLNHPVASLSDSSVLTSTTIDFGTVAEGSGTASIAFDFANFSGIGAPTFASDLDLDAVLELAGDTSVLTTDVGLFAGLGQGLTSSFDALLDTSTAGAFSATYQFTFSGEDLPGEQSQNLFLTLMGTVDAAGLAGDYNFDGTVDAEDYTAYRDTFGSTTLLDTDGDGSGTVDFADYGVWVTNFGNSSSTSAAVPEPVGLALLFIALPLLAGRCTRHG